MVDLKFGGKERVVVVQKEVEDGGACTRGDVEFGFRCSGGRRGG